MDLKIDTHPKIGSLEFYTLDKKYIESPSPRSVIKQRGLEFESFRTYQLDDDASLIDWKASARSNDILVRVYSEDIALNILIFVDISESMIYGTEKKAKIECAIELAINIAYGAISYGDRVGVLLFNDGIAETINFDTGINHFSEIAARISETKNFGGGVNLEYALGGVMEIFQNTHLLIMISDFIGFGEKLYHSMHAVINKFDILGIMVNDKTDIKLDAGKFYMHFKDPYLEQDGFTKGRLKNYYQANQQRIAELKEFFTTTENELWFFSPSDSIEKIMKLNEERNFTLK